MDLAYENENNGQNCEWNVREKKYRGTERRKEKKKRESKRTIKERKEKTSNSYNTQIIHSYLWHIHSHRVHETIENVHKCCYRYIGCCWCGGLQQQRRQRQRRPVSAHAAQINLSVQISFWIKRYIIYHYYITFFFCLVVFLFRWGKHTAGEWNSFFF